MGEGGPPLVAHQVRSIAANPGFEESNLISVIDLASEDVLVVQKLEVGHHASSTESSVLPSEFKLRCSVANAAGRGRPS